MWNLILHRNKQSEKHTRICVGLNYAIMNQRDKNHCFLREQFFILKIGIDFEGIKVFVRFPENSIFAQFFKITSAFSMRFKWFRSFFWDLLNLMSTRKVKENRKYIWQFWFRIHVFQKFVVLIPRWPQILNLTNKNPTEISRLNFEGH